YGIGLRQICDVAILYHNLCGKIDGQYLKEIYSKLGILKWSTILHELLVEGLGMDRSKLPFQLKSKPEFKWMLNDIVHSGNFGLYDPDSPLMRTEEGRRDRQRKIWGNFRKYLFIAPMEALFFLLFVFKRRVNF